MNPTLTHDHYQIRKNIPKLRAGDRVRVHQEIKEGAKERVQVFEGTVIAKKGGGIGESFTVRKISYGIGVERVFPLSSPLVKKIEVKRKGEVRRAKLYYLRERLGKAQQVREKLEERPVKEAPMETPPAKESEIKEE